MKKYDTIIIGAGLSGLSAAVELAKRNCKTLLLEQHQHLGGRTYSFLDRVTGDQVDNGQHLMMGCYNATRHYLATVGAEHLVTLQPVLKINFLHPLRARSIFSCRSLPAPLHLLGGLLSYKAIPFSDRCKTLRVALDLHSASLDKQQQMDRLTADEWLNLLGQSEISRKHLWDVIIIGALNNYPQNSSALMLFRVLRAAFLGRRKNSSLLFPRVGLSELFVNPAIQFVKAHGGEVRTGIQVRKLKCDRKRILSAHASNGEEFRATNYISAVPWYVFEEIKPRHHGHLQDVPDSKSRFQSSPIIAIHLWLDREITDLEFAALLETRIQWLFNKNTLLNKRKENASARQYLSLVISGAQEFVGLSKEQLIRIAMEDLRRVLHRARNAKVVHSVVMKEKRATFTPRPGLESFRPDVQTGFENFFLAGDWTATGYPATIEGAVLSGQRAAKMVLSEL